MLDPRDTTAPTRRGSARHDSEWGSSYREMVNLHRAMEEHKRSATHRAERYPGAPLEHGDGGRDVRAVQEQLNRLGEQLQVDGQYGPLTEAGVRRSKERSSLETDGVVGPKTWASLWEADQAAAVRVNLLRQTPSGG